MKRFFKKGLSLVFAACLLTGMFAGCSSANEGKAIDMEAVSAVTEEEAAEETQAVVTEETAPAGAGFTETPMDLGGRTIKVLTTVASRYTYAENKDETPNETLEVIEAVKGIEKDYNCKLEFEQLKGREMVEALITAKAAGDTYCDILEFGCSDTYLEQIYSANLVMPLEDEAIKDIIKPDENPWLPESAFGLMFGHQYGVHFKTVNTGDLLRGVILFNKNLAEKYNLGNLYDMVKDKSWTFAKLTELSASIAAQSDGMVYPLLYSQEGLFLPMLIFANGGTVTEYKEGKYTFNGLNDNTLEAINFAVDMKKKNYIHPKSEVRNEAESIFANGEAVFFVCNYNSLKKYTQGTISCEDEVGLLPGPSGPNGDGNYNGVSYTAALFHVMDNVEKPEEAAAVLAALANRTSKHDMIETELMNTLQDEESADILQLMYDHMVCDYSRSISTSRSAISGANKAVMNLEKTPKEAYEEIASGIQADYNELKLTK